MTDNKIYYISTYNYLRRFKGYFDSLEEATKKLDTIVAKSLGDWKERKPKFRWKVEDLEESVKLLHIDCDEMPEYDEIYMEYMQDEPLYFEEEEELEPKAKKTKKKELEDGNETRS